MNENACGDFPLLTNSTEVVVATDSISINWPIERPRNAYSIQILLDGTYEIETPDGGLVKARARTVSEALDAIASHVSCFELARQ